MCIAPVRSAMLKENVGISSFFNTRHNQRLGEDAATKPDDPAAPVGVKQ